MRIAFYAPFKPLGHPHPSGDRVIASGLYHFLAGRGHDIRTVSRMRTRWIYRKPWQWPGVIREYRRSRRQIIRNRPDLWLTYHTYYKAPDVLGPYVARQSGIPYVIFQGIFSTKRRKKLNTLPGYLLNTHALRSARHVFTNRLEDLKNLRRLLPESRLSHIGPGIFPEDFRSDPRARDALRRAWGVGDEPVVLSAAMFRPDVKTEGLAWVIRSCARLMQRGLRFHLVVAGDGKERRRLAALARPCAGRIRFVGKVPRAEMHRFYSAGDLFAFPGIRESLGMVFLESQSCGLPVVAFDNGGIPEVVADRKTGFLVPPFDEDLFDHTLEVLILNKELRRDMGRKARRHVRNLHDLNRNYRQMERVLHQISGEKYHEPS
ncbi:glycosyl transferase group 1 [Desulfonema ishimotonii]|uniref:Glycosyl transferase group 1 n=1 Tax=Desulfonema ishimotonii TaxID=45657 RepID=A0A401G1W7_9BACT|nr:glycosyltransferase family 4 protein [Desulfonema ishimotonii]GBC63210.1 glycosyl transferase group 1 [Desulfonema ishimotonii]